MAGPVGLNLLQDVFFKSSGDKYPWLGVVFGIVFAGGFLFLLIYAILKNRKNVPGASRLGGFALYKIAKSYGLDRIQKKTLRDVFREDRGPSEDDPLTVMKDAALLDEQFKRAYQHIGDSVEDETTAELQIALLFSVRNAIEAVQNTTGTTTRGQVSLIHQIHRRYRRRQISVPCTLAMVAVREVMVHRKKVRKMSLDGRRYTGTIMDISIGGCSVNCTENIEPGARNKIEFVSGDSPRAALAQVLRVNRADKSGIIHMKFTKLPRRTQNAINALVFEYGK
jgi:hypothetical protein